MLDKTFDPQQIERRWYHLWEQAGYFAPSAEGTDGYCIMIPPPNVTGSLHMGHGFNNTLMDALIRYQRMTGRRTVWQPGTDHAGIATQMVVERQLEAEGHSRHDLGRDAFIERIWAWKAQSGGTITQQLRRLGSSLDWQHERFTMDDGLSDAVREVFVQLFEEGLIYRGQRLVNWDPILHTAVSDLEVCASEEAGSLWDIRYPLATGTDCLVVSTTRPETLLGDCAVAVNPDDARYQHLIGQFVQLPLTNRQIPIIADSHADPAFGTGCVKITPAHDFNDYGVWQRHCHESAIKAQPQGGLITILTPDAKIKTEAATDGPSLIPATYQGLDRYEARKQIVADLEAQGFLAAVKPHRLMVPRGDRSGAVIEPYLTDQWFVRTQPLAAPAIQAVEDGRIRFVPDHWKNTYFEWMHNIQDWCISRQIWWGHRIPAWYDANGLCYVGRSEAEIRTRYQLADTVVLTQDNDVLDTWFSSALWPFSTLGWPQQTDRLHTFYPTAVLITGFDIIFFWVARMIMMGLKFMGQVPFHDVYIHGLVRDAQGDKMSKSKGNVLDPIDLIDGISLPELLAKRTQGLMQPQLAERIAQQTRRDFPNGIPGFGTDALRFTFAALATTGRDIKFDLGRIEGYRNFCNKLWNAARYVLMNLPEPEVTLAAPEQDAALTLADRWIQSRLATTITTTRDAFTQYRFDLATQAIYEFTWNQFCDWYVETTKIVLTDPDADPATVAATRYTLVQTLEQLLRLMHPFMPFITEEIWQKLKAPAGQTGATIMIAPYPISDDHAVNAQTDAAMQWLQHVVLGIRRIRGEMNISPSRALPLFISQASTQDRDYFTQTGHYIERLARIASMTFLEDDQQAPESAMTLVGTMKLLIPMAGLIDKEAELARLAKDITKAQADVQRLTTKLANPNFIDKAPQSVVTKEQDRLTAQQQALANLCAQRDRIAAL
jgi:valyl-tRNA synthetase